VCVDASKFLNTPRSGPRRGEAGPRRAPRRHRVAYLGERHGRYPAVTMSEHVEGGDAPPGPLESGRHSVLVADDNARTRSRLISILDGSESFYVCAEARDATGAIVAAKREQPDVCLLDINMPGNGIAAAARISNLLPNCSIVMLTVSRLDDDLFDSLRAGASGYLLKGLDESKIPDALARVVAGEAALPGTLVARLVEEFRDREHRRVRSIGGASVRLTGREWDILELMRAGLPTERMAERLFISPTTVRSHVSSILRKLQVRDRASVLALFANDDVPNG